MSWGSQRKTSIILVLLAIGLTIVAVTAIAIFYEAPSCRDGKQNQDETGVDCGGSCTYLCRASVQEPSLRFVKYLPSVNGRTDVIAYIDNPNPRAAIENARFSVSLYDNEGVTVATKVGTVDLPPSSTVPVFIPGFTTGYRTLARAFLLFDEETIRWYTPKTELANVTASKIVFQGGEAPRITADITNQEYEPLYNVTVVATVFDAKNNAIAASASVVDLEARGTTPVVFTWNAAFTGTPARTEVLPLPSLK